MKLNLTIEPKAIKLFSLILALLFSIKSIAAPLPRIMVLMDEKNLGTYSVSESERLISQQLIDRGIEVVDADFVKTTVTRDKLLHAATGGPNAAAAMGLRFGAEIVIVGEALAKGSAAKVKSSDMRSYSATVTLKAIKTDTAQILTTESQSLARMHVDDIAGGTIAIRDATNAALVSFIPKLFDRYDLGGTSSNKIKLLISNVDQLWQLASIKDMLRQTAGVSEVVQRSYVAGIAEFDIQWSGQSDVLAEEVTLLDSSYFKLKILAISQGKLDARLVAVP